MSFCFARDDKNEYRREHKPTPGKYDGNDILSCAWCGKTLTRSYYSPSSLDCAEGETVAGASDNFAGGFTGTRECREHAEIARPDWTEFTVAADKSVEYPAKARLLQ